MSQCAACYGRQQPRFPRVSGDEPALSARLKSRIEFSPRERG